VRQEAANATASVSVILIVTTLYSTTTFFYQMRRSGEMIYDFKRPKKSLHIRIRALLLFVVAMTVLVIFFLLVALGTFLFSRFLSGDWEKVADYILLCLLSFLLVLLLNIYVCPYKTKLKYFIKGTFVTIGAWGIAVIGFSVYLKIGNVGRLYGALSAVIVFLLWLYILMIGFIIGVILNSEKITKQIQQKRKSKRKNARKRKTV
jgi:membrane protein